MLYPLVLLCGLLVGTPPEAVEPAPATPAVSQPRSIPNLVYATREKLDGSERPMRLDLHLPGGDDSAKPVIVWFHGGGWAFGNRAWPSQVAFLIREGYAIANVEYRFSQEAAFPAQIFDCKAALRFLRENADEYGLDPDRIVLAGESAGGHLALLLGLSSGAGELVEDPELLRDDGVAAIVDLYGPTDLTLDNTVGNERLRRMYRNFGQMFLGGTFEGKLDLAKRASPITYVDADDPPVLILHGTRDGMVPMEHSERLAQRLERAGVEHEFVELRNAGHAGPRWFQPDVRQLILDFLDEHVPADDESRDPSVLR